MEKMYRICFKNGIWRSPDHATCQRLNVSCFDQLLAIKISQYNELSIKDNVSYIWALSIGHTSSGVAPLSPRDYCIVF